MSREIARPVALALALSAVVAAPVHSDDSTAGLAAGGIQLTKSSTITMRSENLYISEASVRAQFQFVNTAPADVTVIVAFPLPDVTTGPMEEHADYPVDSATNFLGFSTTVGGKPVKMQVEQKVLLNGHDYTALLQKMGVPLAPQRDATDKVLSNLPRAEQDQLVKLGLADASDNPPDIGNAAKLSLYGTWTLKTTFYWTQTFPAGRTVDIEQTYTPSVGSEAMTWWGNDATPTEPEALQEKTDYCIDDDFMAGARALHLSGAAYVPAFIDYVLTSGANWKGPIGDFTMTIDKGSARNLVSFCGDGVRKTGPTTFQVHQANFTPTRDVKVLIYKVVSN